MTKPIDLANLKRVLELGSAECCRDAGLQNFAINVSVQELSAGHVIAVDVVTLTPEQAAELKVEMDAEHATESAKRSREN